MMIVNADSFSLLSQQDIQEINTLLYWETELLDQKRYSEWIELYAEDCIYWIPGHAEQTDPVNELSLFYEDRELMQMRIHRIEHPVAHSINHDLRCSHVCSDRYIESISDDINEIVLTNRFQMQEYHHGETRLFGGRFEYMLVREQNAFRIRQKRVELIQSDALLEVIQVFI